MNTKDFQIVNRVGNLLKRDRIKIKSQVADSKLGYSLLTIQDNSGETREIKLQSNSFVTGTTVGQIG